MPKQRRKKRVYTMRAADPASDSGEVKIVQTTEVDGKHSHTHFVIRKLNVVRPICDIMLGDSHPVQHRFAMGAVIMTMGVALAKSAGHHPVALIAHIGDLIGYSLHGFGLMPFLEHILGKVKEHEHKAGEAVRGEVQRE